jgi:hypothetical protein
MLLQSDGQVAADSPDSHLPLPHVTLPQSNGQLESVSPVFKSHTPSPHLRAPQSTAQDAAVSPLAVSQYPSPQSGLQSPQLDSVSPELCSHKPLLLQLPQSAGHEPALSEVSQILFPQTGMHLPQSEEHDEHDSVDWSQ